MDVKTSLPCLVLQKHNIDEMKKEQFLVANGLITMFNYYLGMVVEHISFLTPPSSKIWGLGSCFWSNSRGVC